MAHFLESSRTGTQGEEFIEGLLRRAGARTEREKGFLGHDFVASIGGRKFAVEVKVDLKEATTGNIAMEYRNTKQGKPSGIMATESDLWAVVLQKPLTAWLSRTATLREFFKNSPCLRDVTNGGDNNSAMKLFKRVEIFAACFVRIDELPPADLKKIVVELLGG